MLFRKNKFENFCQIYGNLYDPEDLKVIKEGFINHSYESSENYDIINQVNSYLNIYKCSNPYLEFIDYLKQYYNIDRNLLDVGSGVFPELARRIQMEQKNGSIECYDPYSLFCCFNGIKINREKFTLDTDVSKYDMLIGHMPCDATIPMIIAANKNDKDLLINLCGCIHLDFINYFYPNFYIREAWLSQIIESIESTLPSDRSYSLEHPEFSPYGIIRTYKK